MTAYIIIYIILAAIYTACTCVAVHFAAAASLVPEALAASGLLSIIGTCRYIYAAWESVADMLDAAGSCGGRLAALPVMKGSGHGAGKILLCRKGVLIAVKGVRAQLVGYGRVEASFAGGGISLLLHTYDGDVAVESGPFSGLPFLAARKILEEAADRHHCTAR